MKATENTAKSAAPFLNETAVPYTVSRFPDGLVEDFHKTMERFAGLAPHEIAAAFTKVFTEATRNRKAASRPQAYLRGLAAREEYKLAEGGSLSADEARHFLHAVSKTTLLNKYKKGEVLAYKEGRAYRFPVWQFAESGGLLPGLAEVLTVFAADPDSDDWARMLFFLNPRLSLDSKRPLDLLRTGTPENVARVVSLAEDAATF